MMMNNPAEKLNVYLVGGAVRDQLLGLEVKDRDWVVVGSTPEQMIELGFIQVGQDFPVFLHPTNKEEYALARTEHKTTPGYRGFKIYSDPSITLEQDLIRRDLTINAIAMARDQSIIDPYGGVEDIKCRRLRHVSTAFCEDPVRILRLARFATRFKPQDFKVAPETLQLMREMVSRGEINALVAERVWQEVHSALMLRSPSIFIKVLRQCGALAKILPEIDALFGVPQPEEYHPEIDTGEHILLCVDIAAGTGGHAALAFAALVHDVGKAMTPINQWPAHHGHEKMGLSRIKVLCERLRVPTEIKKLALSVGEFHLRLHRIFELRPATILQLLNAMDAFRKSTNVEQFIQVCEADWRGRAKMQNRVYPQAEFFTACYKAAMTVKPSKQALTSRDGQVIQQSLQQGRIATIANVKRYMA